MANFKLFIMMLGMISWSSQALELSDFKTDYCTYFPEGTIASPNLWKHCCYDHDLRYWFGGSQKDMDLSDERLRQCVSLVGGSFVANLMYYGIRAGHSSPVKNKYKWGWGFGDREIKPLTSAEKLIINQALDGLDLDPKYLQEFKTFYQL